MTPGGTIACPARGAIGLASTIPADRASIVGVVANDPFGRDQNAASGTLVPGRPSQLVYLDLNHDGKLDSGDPTAVTDSAGTYLFNGVTPGTFTVGINLFPGEFLAYPGGGMVSVTAAGGQSTTAEMYFGVGQNSVLAPLTVDLTPFGTSPPDMQTAEAAAYYHLFLGRAPDAPGLAAAVSYLKRAAARSRRSPSSS